MLQIGKRYSFKTLSYFYVGTVVQLYPSHAELSDALEVFDTGPNDTYYRGTIAQSERIPDGTLVPLCGQVTIMPYGVQL